MSNQVVEKQKSQPHKAINSRGYDTKRTSGQGLAIGSFLASMSKRVAIFSLFVQIRRSAIKELPNLCKENTNHLLRIADVLTQLLQSDDPQEVNIVNISLMSLFKIDMKGTQVFHSLFRKKTKTNL